MRAAGGSLFEKAASATFSKISRRVSGVQASRRDLGAGGLSLIAQMRSGPRKIKDFMGANWRDNVNYVRSFGRHDDGYFQ